MTVKDLQKLYNQIDTRLLTLEKAILNHTSVHKWDRIIQASGLILMTVVILLLKFKIM